MKSLSKRFTKHITRRGESGQSIILLAMGFIALLGFVGIVTDVSLMFVRYSTLRRAVDAASIAAAGQMRQDRTLATVGLAARQFIEFHGIDPKDVLVETCASVPDYNEDGVQDYLDDAQLCPQDQRKMVRVTAQIESPTVFLRLLGWQNLTLEASAISETAVLDVIVVMDVSESMLRETTYEDWARIGQGVVYVPPRIGGPSDTAANGTIFGKMVTDGVYPGGSTGYINFWQQQLVGNPSINVSQSTVNARLRYTGGNPVLNPPNDPVLTDARYGVSYFVPAAYNVYGTQTHPRTQCRVRFIPISRDFAVPNDPPNTLRTLYQQNGFTWGDPNGEWDGFVPTYNFYGCCNDPGSNGTVDIDGNITGINSTAPDGDFSDLVCQPFKQARDATRQFLERIDFIRGDRVGFVVFDRSAYVVNPYDDNQVADGGTHMLDNFGDAVEALNRVIGVRAEPNFYIWDGAAAEWGEFSSGFDPNGNPIPVNYDDGSYYGNDYPVKDHCPYHNAAMFWPFTKTYNNPPVSNPSAAVLASIMTPRPTDPAWSGYGLDYRNAYELWASCRAGNMGAGLREANNALLDPRTSRRSGAVWVIILLSDGAAGASDPVRRNGVKPALPQPYAPTTPGIYGVPGEYGSLGLCPYGTRDNPAELTDTMNPAEDPVIFPFCLDEDPESRHFCSFRPELARETGDETKTHDVDFDENLDPDAYQNFVENVAAGNVYDVDIADPSDPCDMLYYDVDDYARDWADYVGLPAADAGGEAQLPVIFTIGFGINFVLGDGSCAANIADCLGEEFLRYLADVGDNNQIDQDFQQALRVNKDGTIPVHIDGGFGLPGVCEDPIIESRRNGAGDYASVDDMIERLPPKQNCGNYFNAPDQQELEEVFDEIASRMFTRLAG